jgi:precorrin-8X/cobalt-precorrin-8 methylmutase
MAERVDLSAWPDGARQVVARMIHATADESFASSTRIGADAVEGAVAALRRRAMVVCDTRMVMAGMPRLAMRRCYLDGVPSAPPAGTRSAAGIEMAARKNPDGALWVIGNAPTALFRLLELHADGAVRPAAVIGLPVGYVGAAEAKATLWSSPLQPLAITNVGYRGGSPVAAAAVNALAALAALTARATLPAAGATDRPDSPT